MFCLSGQPCIWLWFTAQPGRDKGWKGSEALASSQSQQSHGQGIPPETLHKAFTGIRFWYNTIPRIEGLVCGEWGQITWHQNITKCKPPHKHVALYIFLPLWILWFLPQLKGLFWIVHQSHPFLLSRGGQGWWCRLGCWSHCSEWPDAAAKVNSLWTPNTFALLN